MKVIEFPKNRQIEFKNRNAKLSSAIKMLEYLVDSGADYHIVISKEQAKKIYNGNLREYTVITSNLTEAKNLQINKNNFNIYVLEGNEFG